MFLIWFYTVVGCIFMFAATYSFIIWRYLHGLRGLMMTLMFLGISINAFTVVFFGAGFRSRVDADTILAISRSSLFLSSIAALFVADRYAADANNHRALTTIAYLWFLKATEEKGK